MEIALEMKEDIPACGAQVIFKVINNNELCQLYKCAKDSTNIARWSIC